MTPTTRDAADMIVVLLLLIKYSVTFHIYVYFKVKSQLTKVCSFYLWLHVKTHSYPQLFQVLLAEALFVTGGPWWP